ncbi:MAG: glycosyltransferase [Candidatus Eremiobacteraeota bacterium]|nr:glycosyltransferase [Candidatus Eremiobacteraeota bacterium]
MSELDIIIPVYNEGDNIVPTLNSLREHVKTPCRVLIGYDFETDTTLEALKRHDFSPLNIVLIKNQGKGAQGAVLTGFAAAESKAIVVMPADDDFNAPILDEMVEKCRQGCEIVTASRFLPGGCMEGCPLLKAVLVRTASFLLYHLARVPSHDSTSGFRLFSRRVVRSIPVESTKGFVYSIELLVKAHRLGWRVGEVPARWYERKHGQSRFQVVGWLPAYLKWFFYAFATTYLRRGPETVKLSSYTI